MQTRLLWAIALTALLFLPSPAERATFILVDGERIGGAVVFHTPDAVNLFRGDFNVGLPDGKEMPIHQEQVVAIEFLAGTPATAELAAIPKSGQLMVMRNGDFKRGSLINLVRGDTVRWKAENGNEEEYPIRDVRRIYLQADAARSLYNYTAPPAATQPAGPPNTDATRQKQSIKNAWSDAGITLYSQTDFGGESSNFRRDVPDLRRFDVNDKAHSFQIANGERWEVCVDINYEGRCETFTGDQANLDKINWGGVISSLRRVR